MYNTTTSTPLSITATVDSPIMEKMNYGFDAINSPGLESLNHRSMETPYYSKKPRTMPFEPENILEIAYVLQDTYNSIFKSTRDFLNLPKTYLSSSDRTLSFEKIMWDKYTIQLDHELSVQVSFIDGLWKGYYEDLGIFVAAPDVGQCKNDFQEEFCMLWEEYANETDDGLTLDAQKLKYKLLDLAKGVAIEDQD